MKKWISNEGKAYQEKCQHLQFKLDGYDQKLKNLHLKYETLKEEMQYISEKHQSSLQTNILLQERLSKQEIYIKMKENTKQSEQSLSEYANISIDIKDIQKELSLKNLDIANISETNILIEQENKDLRKSSEFIEMKLNKSCSENEKLQASNHSLKLQKIQRLETIEFLKLNNESYLLQIQHLDNTLEEIHQQFSHKKSYNSGTSVKNVLFMDKVSVDPYLSDKQKSLFSELNIYSSLGSPEQVLSVRKHYPQCTTDDVAFYARYLSLQSNDNTPNLTLDMYDNSEGEDGREKSNELSVNQSLETVSESMESPDVVKKVNVVNENSISLVIKEEPFKYNYGSNKEYLLPKGKPKNSRCVCCSIHVF